MLKRKSTHEILSTRSDEMAEQLSSPDFYALSLAEQLFVVDAVLDAVKADCRKRRQLLTQTPVAIDGSHAYVRTRSADMPAFRKIAISGTTITGEMAGLTVLERSRLLFGWKLYG